MPVLCIFKIEQLISNIARQLQQQEQLIAPLLLLRKLSQYYIVS